MSKERLLGFAKILTGLVILLVLSYFINANQKLLLQYASYGYFGILVSCFISNSTVFLPAPSSTIVFTFASIYNPFIVAAIGALGAALGEVVGYSLGYTGKALVNDDKQIIHQWTTRYGSGAVFVFAFLPLPIFDLVGVTAGVLKISFLGFFIPTLLGKWLKMLIYAYLGAGLIPFLSPIFLKLFR